VYSLLSRRAASLEGEDRENDRTHNRPFHVLLFPRLHPSDGYLLHRGGVDDLEGVGQDLLGDAMKKRSVSEQPYCDYCGKSSWEHCLWCGKDICWECQKMVAKEYKHAVHFSGSGDGLYCRECDSMAREASDPLNAAYRVIDALRHEEEGWWADFKKRSDNAEAELAKLQEKKS
jgi:hypothetical protein